MNRWIRYISCFCLCMLVCLLTIEAQDNKQYQVPFEKGTLVLVPLQDNAVRIQYVEGTTNQLPEWVYVASHNTEIRSSWKCKDNEVLLRLKRMSISVNRLSQEVTIKDKQGKMQEETGTYEYDTEKNTVRFKWQGKTQLKRDFLLENGSLSGALKLGWRTLYLQFEQK